MSTPKGTLAKRVPTSGSSHDQIGVVFRIFLPQVEILGRRPAFKPLLIVLLALMETRLS